MKSVTFFGPSAINCNESDDTNGIISYFQSDFKNIDFCRLKDKNVIIYASFY